MKLIIYNPNSTGGNYEYARKMHRTYTEYPPPLDSIELIFPANAKDELLSGEKRLLLSDKLTTNNLTLSRLYFLLRSFLNPIIFFFYLLRKERSAVLFNDFDQLSAPMWSPLFRWILSKHVYGVLLHDPDRDNYLSNIRWSEWTMKELMKCMDIGFYHTYLPPKPYFQETSTTFVSLPHGLYDFDNVKSDEQLKNRIQDFKGNTPLISVLGNIRKEKNYLLLIEAVKELPVRLLIAGKEANSSVNLDEIQLKVRELGLVEKVMVFNKYLSNEEMKAAIELTDIVSLYYAASFTSQSGVINLVAPFKKKLLVSDTPSGLSVLVRQFDLGQLVKPDDVEGCKSGIENLLSQNRTGNWVPYLRYASWQRHKEIVIKSFNEVI